MNSFGHITAYLMTAALMGLSFWLVTKRQYRTSALSISLSFASFVIAQLNGDFLSKFWNDLSIEQFVCWGFGFAFLLLSVYFAHKDSLAYAFVILLISVFACFCGLSSVQALLKTHLLWMVTSSLQSYGEKIDNYQKTVASMHESLSQQQSELSSNQSVISREQDEFKVQIANVEKELSQQQNKINEAEFGVSRQQSDITNQFRQISLVQFGLNIAQTNLAEQQAKLTNVESLVKTLYSDTEDEDILTSNTNEVIIQKLAGVQNVILKLKFAPIPNSIQALLTQNGTQVPLLPQMGQERNILLTRFFNNGDLNGTSFHLRYIKNISETNLVKNMVLINSNFLSCDGVLYNLNPQ